MALPIWFYKKQIDSMVSTWLFWALSDGVGYFKRLADFIEYFISPQHSKAETMLDFGIVKRRERGTLYKILL